MLLLGTDSSFMAFAVIGSAVFVGCILAIALAIHAKDVKKRK